VRISFSFTEDEYIAAIKLDRSTSLSLRTKTLHRFVMVLGFFLIGGWFFHLVVGPRPRYLYLTGPHRPMTWAWDIGALVGIFLVCGYFFSQSLPASKNYAEDDQIGQELVAEVSDSSIRIETVAGHTELFWTALKSYTESEVLFLIYLSKKPFLAFPKRAFAGDDLNQFREFLASRLTRAR
jgi:drug/metabolite transporter (DMT)-like permease